jgi:hypothetical protein
MSCAYQYGSLKPYLDNEPRHISLYRERTTPTLGCRCQIVYCLSSSTWYHIVVLIQYAGTLSYRWRNKCNHHHRLLKKKSNYIRR